MRESIKGNLKWVLFVSFLGSSLVYTKSTTIETIKDQEYKELRREFVDSCVINSILRDKIERLQESNSEYLDQININNLCPECENDHYRYKHPEKCKLIKPCQN